VLSLGMREVFLVSIGAALAIERRV
jgi:hypothetical protein